MISRFARIAFLFVLALGAIVFGVEFAAIITPADPDFDAIYAKVENDGSFYVMSFTSKYAEPNVIYPTRSISSAFQASSSLRFSIFPNSGWVFAYVDSPSSPPDDLALAELGSQRMYSFSLQSLRAWSIDKTGNILFYVGTAPSGQVTYNLMDLESGRRIELTTPMFVSDKWEIDAFVVPVNGWSLEQQPIVIENYSVLVDQPVATGFSSLDLSAIDLTHPGTYPVPQWAMIRRSAEKIGEGYLSPDGHYLAYLNYDGAALSSVEIVRESATAEVIDLGTGEVTTLYADKDKMISQLQWGSEENQLFYLQSGVDGDPAVDLYQYDPATQSNQNALMRFANERVYQVRVCGKTVFYVTHGQMYDNANSLYSTDLSPGDPGMGLYSAAHIELLDCAADSSWRPTRASVCSPFCTPTPGPTPISVNDITVIEWDGGNPAIGESLYKKESCAACHDLGIVGPATDGMMIRILNDRLKVPENAGLTAGQYIAQSILDPGAYVVPDFLDAHPSDYSLHLSVSDVRDLIAYIMEQT